MEALSPKIVNSSMNLHFQPSVPNCGMQAFISSERNGRQWKLGEERRGSSLFRASQTFYLQAWCLPHSPLSMRSLFEVSSVAWSEICSLSGPWGIPRKAGEAQPGALPSGQPTCAVGIGSQEIGLNLLKGAGHARDE